MERLKFFSKNEKFLIKDNFFKQLGEWGKVLREPRGCFKMKALNLSYRFALGYVVLRQGADFNDLKSSDLLCVESWDFQQKEISVRGSGLPSDEAMIHSAVYKNRSSAIFSFYVDAPDFVRSLSPSSLPMIVSREPVDTIDFLKAVEEKLGEGNLIMIQDRGILSFGCTAEDAGGQILKLVDGSKS